MYSDGTFETPLTQCITWRLLNIIPLFLARTDVDVNEKNGKGFTPLILVRYFGLL